MASRELILSFEGPDKVVRPDRFPAKSLLAVLLAFVQLVEKIGGHDAAFDNDEAPFGIVLKELRADSIQYVLGFVPKLESVSPVAARRMGIDAAAAAIQYLERRDVGPPGIRSRAKRLATALARLESVTAHLRGAVVAALSELAEAPPAPTVVAIESFRAKILKAGGLAPRVQLKLAGSGRPITLAAPEGLARLAGTSLYAEVDVTAQIERTADDRVLHGLLTSLRVMESGDPVAAFDRWYERAGKPWANVKDIERGLGRGER
ncbi:hypothetical protein AKJ09_06266 [Labilithrix luteola]|uniref:Uncharacterized protein n=1 Tax=Labilithrix luteola TaxID=1391654 RepID=A0A0K1Q1I8_9BACT|nr:hypothetical protein [Labilithrix luteola]AKU99602.1 hypothetical protein AKJ09_06266 [Labilithrix luteola]